LGDKGSLVARWCSQSIRAFQQSRVLQARVTFSLGAKSATATEFAAFFLQIVIGTVVSSFLADALRRSAA